MLCLIYLIKKFIFLFFYTFIIQGGINELSINYLQETDHFETHKKSLQNVLQKLRS